MQFQTFKYDNELSFLENMSKLEYLRQQINELEKTEMTDSAFPALMLNLLPTRFDNIVSSTKLVKDIVLKDLIEAIDAEDCRLQQRFNRRNENLKNKPVALLLSFKCFACGAQGLKSYECKRKSNSLSTVVEKKISIDNEEVKCKYCK